MELTLLGNKYESKTVEDVVPVMVAFKTAQDELKTFDKGMREAIKNAMGKLETFKCDEFTITNTKDRTKTVAQQIKVPVETPKTIKLQAAVDKTKAAHDAAVSALAAEQTFRDDSEIIKKTTKGRFAIRFNK